MRHSIPSPKQCSDPHGLDSTDSENHCASSRSRMQVDDAVSWKPASTGMEFPPVPFPSRRVFNVAGEGMLRALVKKHHDLLIASPLGRYFPSDPERLTTLINTVANFFVEATGGPADYTAVRDHACMRSRHFPITIDENAREIWLALLLSAFEQVHFPDSIRQEYWEWVEALSIRIINRRTMRAEPRRYSFFEAKEQLRHLMAMPDTSAAQVNDNSWP